MVCPSCGMRQQAKAGYCDQCACLISALVPPPRLGPDCGRAQFLSGFPTRHDNQDVAILALALGLFCAMLAWLPLYVGLLFCALTIICGSTAIHKASRRPFLFWLGWATVIWGAACTIPAFSAF